MGEHSLHVALVNHFTRGDSFESHLTLRARVWVGPQRRNEIRDTSRRTNVLTCRGSTTSSAMNLVHLDHSSVRCFFLFLWDGFLGIQTSCMCIEILETFVSEKVSSQELPTWIVSPYHSRYLYVNSITVTKIHRVRYDRSVSVHNHDRTSQVLGEPTSSSKT